MRWSDLPIHPTPRVLRQFAAAWLVFFLILGAHQFLARGHQQWGAVLMILAGLVGLPGLIKPGVVRWPYVVSMVMAFPIGWVISQLMLALMFYGIITPVALLFRIRGRDALGRKPAPDRPTYWTPVQPPRDVRSFFRQY